MPYALFCHDAQLSQIYETEEEVWIHASKAGMVVDAVADEKAEKPRRVLDRNHSIKLVMARLGIRLSKKILAAAILSLWSTSLQTIARSSIDQAVNATRRAHVIIHAKKPASVAINISR